MRWLPADRRLVAVRLPASYSRQRAASRCWTMMVPARCRRSRSPRYTSCTATDTSCASVCSRSVKRYSGSCPTTENRQASVLSPNTITLSLLFIRTRRTCNRRTNKNNNNNDNEKKKKKKKKKKNNRLTIVIHIIICASPA